ncbi:MAG: type II secretion system F family protein [Candidatus Berkelbacteria bacterium]|nr:MAG: type II secretion system F family protein [Candidatus Berkelbacteria bacterium]QQG51466.1 MAG: type II secretion system F family protein [Candidatus Berkelbacteria bacterium]
MAKRAYDFAAVLTRRVSASDKAFIARQLAVMIESGLPITQAIRSLIEQTVNPSVEEALGVILKDLENGYKFSDAIKKHPRIFNTVFVAVIAAGEATGKLDVALDLLATEQERDQRFRGRVIGALLYPAFIVGAMIIVAIIMVTRIVPALESVFKEANVDLPWMTRVVIGITNSLINYWWLYIIGIIVVVAWFLRWLHSDEGKRSFNNLVLRLPAFGLLIRNLEMARFTGIFALMVQSGVPIIHAIESVAQVLDNEIYREALLNVARNVERGSPIAQSMTKYDVFPPTVTQMVAVGEESGKLEQVLYRLSTYYEAETDQNIKNVTALTEPVVFIVVGLGVAFLVFSIIVPIYNLASVIK